ncbi:MAG: hypothetical protein HY554_07890, partial [Elusimicrobia bacterium]|nr:hypothetical protein [Elusimicrobiota bacterium]
VDLDVADVDGVGKAEIVLGEAGGLKAFPAEPATEAWTAGCAYQPAATGVRLLSLEALDLDGDGRAEVFATHHNEFFSRVETVVLDCRAGAFTPLATLPWMVRSVWDAQGRRSLAAQALVSDGSFPFGAIYPLRHAEGKYQLGSPALRAKRLEWIYSFARTETAAGDGPSAVFYDKNGRLRAVLGKKSWTSPEPLGQTSNRIRWHERLLRFAPRLPTIGSEKGFAGVYAIRNQPRLGTLAEAFGVYGKGEVQRLRWNGLSLEPEWTAEADGYVAGIAVGDAPGAPVYAAIVGAGGSTAVWKFAAAAP